MKNHFQKKMILLLLLVSVVSFSYATDWSANFEAVAYSGSARNLYFYKTALKAKYDAADDALVHRGIGMNWLSGWSAGSSGFDASCYVPGGGYDDYYFAGNEYARVDENTGTLKGYSSIASGWPGLANTYFQADIDAACFSGSSRKLYFFKGNQYIGYNLDNETIVSGGTISAGWPGLTDPYWQSDIESACYSGVDRIIYFFKGDRYVRYNVANETMEYQGTIQSVWRALLAAGAPDFSAASWMTDANPYIKDFKLNEIPMPGSHNALYYYEGAGGMCYVQYNYPDDQMSWGGARYFDVRPYVYQISNSVYGFGGFHGEMCSNKEYDLTTKMNDVKTKLQGTNEIIILHIKQMKFGAGSEEDLKTAFITMLDNVFGSMIITPAEAPNGPYGYTIEHLLTKGQVLIISEYSYSMPLYFTDFPRATGNNGNYLWYPYVAEGNPNDLAATYQSSYLPSTPNLTDKFLCVGASVNWSFNLKSSAVDWNEWFYKNKIDDWCKSGYNWIHAMDYVGWDQGWSRNIAKRLYQEGIARGIIAQQNLKSAVLIPTEPAEERIKPVLGTLKIWPNPTNKSYVQVLFGALADGDATINLHTIGGQVVLNKVEPIHKGENNISLNLPELDTGIYMVELTMKNNRQISRLVIQ